MTPSLLHFPKKKERKMRMNKNNKPIGKHSRCLKAIARGGVEATRPILSFFLFFLKHRFVGNTKVSLFFRTDQ